MSRARTVVLGRQESQDSSFSGSDETKSLEYLDLSVRV